MYVLLADDFYDVITVTDFIRPFMMLTSKYQIDERPLSTAEAVRLHFWIINSRCGHLIVLCLLDHWITHQHF
jgi:hypothetical protein